MASPISRGSAPIARLAATITPHTAIGPGFIRTARTDVAMAVPTPTGRSSNIGSDTTPITRTTSANRKPTPMPMIVIVRPCGVVSASRTKAWAETGASGPSVTV